MEAYARQGYFDAQPGKGQLLASMLLEAAALLEDNPDCLMYVVSRQAGFVDVVWVFEAWTSKEAHEDSLGDKRVGELIERARPMIAGMSGQTELIPVGGKGLSLED